MFKSVITTENARVILANAEATANDKAVAKFILAIDGKSDSEAVDIAEAMNKNALAVAVASLWNGDKFDFDRFAVKVDKESSHVDNVVYPFINVEATSEKDFITSKAVAVRDIFCIKKNKNSTKSEVPTLILGMVSMLGHNMGVSFANDHKDVVCVLKRFTKFSNAPKCFFEDTASSNNSMEKQFQTIMDEMLGANNAPKSKKKYVVHAKDTFIRTTADGYKNGNEIALLQIIVDHIADCRNGKDYKHTSKLACHKVPKEDESNN